MHHETKLQPLFTIASIYYRGYMSLYRKLYLFITSCLNSQIPRNSKRSPQCNSGSNFVHSYFIPKPREFQLHFFLGTPKPFPRSKHQLKMQLEKIKSTTGFSSDCINILPFLLHQSGVRERGDGQSNIQQKTTVLKGPPTTQASCYK